MLNKMRALNIDMEIRITCGVGEASTKLAAFDMALFSAGIANYNLIRLSSIIPEGVKIKSGKVNWNQKEHGYKLYVVLSKYIETSKGKEACAGLGWMQDKTGKGLFVEHYGSSNKEVRCLIKKSLKNIREYRVGKYGKICQKLIGIKCKGKPVCAIVCAVFKSEKW